MSEAEKRGELWGERIAKWLMFAAITGVAYSLGRRFGPEIGIAFWFVGITLNGINWKIMRIEGRLDDGPAEQASRHPQSDPRVGFGGTPQSDAAADRRDH